MKAGRNSVMFLSSLLQSGVYRGNQGRLTRRLVFIFLVICISISYRQMYYSIYLPSGLASVMPVAFVIIVVGGSWISYRLIQYQPVADFLIDVQQESLKVSWSTLQELHRTTAVVLTAMFFFSTYLFVCDVFWQFLLRSLSVLSI